MRSFLIGSLLALSQAQTIVQIAQADPELRFLVDALVAGGLVETLNGTGPFTVFAPINQGFDALGRNILDYVLNPDHIKTLDGVLTYHVVAGAVTSDQLHDGEVVPTLDGTETVTVHIAGAEVRINNARVLRANIKASNGVIHVIDNVLVPSDFALPKDDIVTTAKSVASLSTLVTAVGAAGVAADLSAPNGPFTVFAPNNDAFAKLPAAELQYLLAHPAELRAILFYHVTDHRIYADEIKDYARARTLNGQELVFFVAANGTVLINGYSKVIATNVDCQNGVVHVVDTVILPAAMASRAAAWAAANPALPNLVQLAQSVPELSTLVTAVVAANLVTTLSSPGPFTVFAPTNDAFNALPPGVLSYLLNNTADLTAVLTYHVLAGAVNSSAVTDGETAKTVQGDDIRFRVIGNKQRGYQIFVNEFARVIKADNFASNGIAHIIDQVLLPETPRRV